MRYVVLRKDGYYVQRQVIPGLSSTTSYATGTPDARDAHDFKTLQRAKNWIRAQGIQARVEILTDDGYWPLEDE